MKHLVELLGAVLLGLPWLAGMVLAKGRALSELDHARLLTAIGRIGAAAEMVNG